jgi:hypothetical protein
MTSAVALDDYVVRVMFGVYREFVRKPGIRSRADGAARSRIAWKAGAPPVRVEPSRWSRRQAAASGSPIKRSVARLASAASQMTGASR